MKSFIVIIIISQFSITCIDSKTSNLKQETQTISTNTDTLSSFPPASHIKPILIKSDSLYLPDSLKQKGVKGIVLVEFVVDTLGNVKNIKIIKSENNIMNIFAKNYVQTFRFEPSTINLKRIEVKMRIPVLFK